jgi:hypothetical protein
LGIGDWGLGIIRIIIKINLILILILMHTFIC